MRWGRWPVIVSVGFLATTVVFAGGASALQKSSIPSPVRLVTISVPARAGEIPSKWLNYPGPPWANVLLPAGYSPHQRYPLLVLLHGLGGNYDSYAQEGLTKEFDNLGAIVVMPEEAQAVGTPIGGTTASAAARRGRPMSSTT